MADLVIGDYDAAITIDGSTHYLLIQPGNASTAYKKINRDVFLGVTGQPADISTSQNLTNKTLDNTNTLIVRDDRFTLQDSADTSKQAVFQLSGITAATTRTYTLPNASSTLADISTAQTFTNKTLTSPVITGGSISNTTVSVDAIAEFTPANGVTVDGLNIKDGKLNTNNSVVTANITDAATTPAKLVTGTGSSWAWQSWTPTWTNLTVTSSTVSAMYNQTGKTVFFTISVVLGGGNAPSGSVSFTLPVTAAARYSAAYPIAQLYMEDAGSAFFEGVVVSTSTTAAGLRALGVAGTYLNVAVISSTVPFAWGNTDFFLISGSYEAA